MVNKVRKKSCYIGKCKRGIKKNDGSFFSVVTIRTQAIAFSSLQQGILREITEPGCIRFPDIMAFYKEFAVIIGLTWTGDWSANEILRWD